MEMRAPKKSDQNRRFAADLSARQDDAPHQLRQASPLEHSMKPNCSHGQKKKE